MNIDVFDLPNVSALEVAETIATHMLKQAARSTDRTLCVYKNPDGLMCAAGVLFDSERCTDLRLSCEGMSWGELVEFGLVPKKHAKLIRALQRLHDSVVPQHWPAALYSLFVSFDLDTALVYELCQYNDNRNIFVR